MHKKIKSKNISVIAHYSANVKSTFATFATDLIQFSLYELYYTILLAEQIKVNIGTYVACTMSVVIVSGDVLIIIELHY